MDFEEVEEYIRKNIESYRISKDTVDTVDIDQLIIDLCDDDSVKLSENEIEKLVFEIVDSRGRAL